MQFAEKQQEELGEIDRSGSCAVVAIIIDDVCFVANVGDSRAIMSQSAGQEVYNLSTDHKPSEANELKRIQANGGRVY